MKRYRVLLLCGLLGLPMAGCHSNIVYTAVDPTVLTPKPAAYDVQIEYGSVRRPHRVIGEVRVTRKITPNFGQTGAFDLAVEEMKVHARQVGGDAVVNLKAIDSQQGGAEGRLTLVGTVVVFSGPLAPGSNSR